jgi:hypothetical protein
LTQNQNKLLACDGRVRSSKTKSGSLSPVELPFLGVTLEPEPTAELVRSENEYAFPEVENPPAPRRNIVFLDEENKISINKGLSY